MSFTAEHMAEIFSALGQRNSKKGGADKRRATRFTHRTQVTIIPHVGGVPSTPMQVQLVDFSPRGARLVVDKSMHLGSEFIILLPRQSEQPVPILCTVVHSRVVDAGHVSIGAEFVCISEGSVGTPKDSDSAAKSEARIKQSILG